MSDTTPISLGAERAKRTNDNRAITPAECCDDVAETLRRGDVKANRILVITLDDDPDGLYDVDWWAANISAPEMLALIEVTKDIILRGMRGHD